MSFLCLFGLTNFDQNGKVCAGSLANEQESKANFLYLLSKYNQNFLKEQNLEVPAFFKEDLNKVLSEVEKGGDFEKAKATVLANCLPEVQLCAKTSANEQEIIRKLNDKVSIKDDKFASKVGKAVNHLQLNYIITLISGNLFDSILIRAETAGQDKKTKSEVYKDIIKYNSLVLTADKVKENKLTVEDLKTMAG